MRFHVWPKWVLLHGLLTVALLGGQSRTHAADFLMVIDSSGSMSDVMKDGQTKIAAAKQALNELKPDLSAHQVGLIVFGHRSDPKTPGCCQDVQMVLPISAFDESKYDAVVQNLSPRGSTPLAQSLLQAGDELVRRDKESPKIVIVVTDGNETCGGDPVAIATQLRTMGINVTIHVVGLGIKPKEVAQLRQLAAAGGGRFGLANTHTELATKVREFAQVVSVPASAPEPKVVEYYRDDFDGEDLSEHWEVLNPDPSSYIVEDGFLNVLSSVELSLYDQSADLPNLFQLTKPLPKGDWIATLRLNPAITTMRETYSLALYSENDKFLLASANVGVAAFAGHLSVNLFGRKAASGKNTDFNKNLYYSKEALGHNNVTDKITAYTELAAKDVQAILLRIRKAGRSYFISGKIEGDAATADGNEPQWVELQKLTSLRSPGKFLAISIGQSKFAGRNLHIQGGETLVNIDWVKIETEN